MGPETSDDAGVYLHRGEGLIATADFITPVCDDPERFGWIAAANSLSDIYAMGGTPLFALNLCCFPVDDVPKEVLAAILTGGAKALREAGAALLGGHSVRDAELKFGLAVIGRADPDRLLTNAGARPGQRLILTKPLGTGVLINAYKKDRLDAAGLEPALVQMERLNARAAAAALAHGATAATDITGFGLAGHALEIARASGVGLTIEHGALPVFEAFHRLAAQGVSTGSTAANRRHAEANLRLRPGLGDTEIELLHDPQTSGGLLIAVDEAAAAALLADLVGAGHTAAQVGSVVEGPARLEIR